MKILRWLLALYLCVSWGISPQGTLLPNAVAEDSLPDFFEADESLLPGLEGTEIWSLNKHEKAIVQYLLEGAFGTDAQKIRAFNRAVGYLQRRTTGELIDLLMLYIGSVNSDNRNNGSSTLSQATLNNPENMTSMRALIASMIESDIRREDLTEALQAVKLTRSILERKWSYFEDNLDPEFSEKAKATLAEGVAKSVQLRQSMAEATLTTTDREEINRIIDAAVDEIVLGKSGIGQESSVMGWVREFEPLLSSNAGESYQNLANSDWGSDSVFKEMIRAATGIKDIRFRTDRLIGELEAKYGDDSQMRGHIRELIEFQSDFSIDSITAGFGFDSFMDLVNQGFGAEAGQWRNPRRTTKGRARSESGPGGQAKGQPDTGEGDADQEPFAGTEYQTETPGLDFNRAAYDDWLITMGHLRDFVLSKVDVPNAGYNLDYLFNLQRPLRIDESGDGVHLVGGTGVDYDFKIPLTLQETRNVRGWLSSGRVFPEATASQMRKVLKDLDRGELNKVRADIKTMTDELVRTFVLETQWDEFKDKDPYLEVNRMQAHVSEGLGDRIWVGKDHVFDLGHQYIAKVMNLDEVERVQVAWDQFLDEKFPNMRNFLMDRFWSAARGGFAATSETRDQLGQRFNDSLDVRVRKVLQTLNRIADEANDGSSVAKSSRRLRLDIQRWRGGVKDQVARSMLHYADSAKMDLARMRQLTEDSKKGLASWLTQRPSLDAYRARLREYEATVMKVADSNPANALFVSDVRQLFSYLRGENEGMSLLQLNTELLNEVGRIVGDDEERKLLAKMLENPVWAVNLAQSVGSLGQNLIRLGEFEPTPQWKLRFMKTLDEIATEGIKEIRSSMKELSEHKDFQLEFKPFEVYLRLVLRHYYEFRAPIDYRDTLISLVGMEGSSVEDFLGVILANSGIHLQKMFQVLAKQRGMGDDFKKLFEVLESDLPPVPFDEVDKILKKAIPDLYPSRFQSIAREGKRGSAAQTHLAKFKTDSGEVITVVVRFLLPGAVEAAAKDEQIFTNINGMAKKHPELKGAAANQIEELQSSTAKIVNEELDASQTVDNVNRGFMAFQMATTKTAVIDGQKRKVIYNFVVPQALHPETAEKGVIIMEGVERFWKFSDVFDQNPTFAAGTAESLVSAVVGNALTRGDGFFHGDLHQGNIGISFGVDERWPAPGYEEGDIVVNAFIFDWGMVGDLGELRGDLFLLSSALASKNRQRSVELAPVMMSNSIDEELILEAVEVAIERASADGESPDVGYLATELTNRGGSIPDAIFRLNRTINTAQQFLTESGARSLGDVVEDNVVDGILDEAIARIKSVMFGSEVAPEESLAISNAEFFKLIGGGIKTKCTNALKR